MHIAKSKLIFGIPFKLLCAYVLFVSFFLSDKAIAQELEPRAINNLPIGSNFILAGYAYAQGNMLLDAALPIEGLDSRIHSGFAAYVRSIKFLGMSSKIDLVLPFASGSYEGSFEEESHDVTRSGFGDLRMRFSFNFVGSKAMTAEEFKEYSPKWVSGLSLQAIIPTGYYDSDYLINPGSNRWALKPQLGLARTFDKWSLEGYIGFWFFGTNNDFLNGKELKQEPLYTFKVHGIRTLKNDQWMSLSAGYAVGGITEVDGVQRETQISTMRIAFMYAFSLSIRHSIKLAALTSVRFERGSDFNGLSMAYQYRWKKK